MLLLLLYQLPWPWHPPSYNPMVYRHPSPKPLLSFECVLFSSFDNKWALWLLDVFSSYRKSVLMRSRIKPNCRLIHVPLYINRHAACLKSTHKTLFDSQKENTSTTDYYYYYGCCVLFLSFFLFLLRSAIYRDNLSRPWAPRLLQTNYRTRRYTFTIQLDRNKNKQQQGKVKKRENKSRLRRENSLSLPDDGLDKGGGGGR